MTSKCILFFSGDQLDAYEWMKGRVAASHRFHLEEDGLAAFGHFLATVPHTPLKLLIDVVEEEFHNEIIPKVYGPDRNALIRRRLDRLFHDTPYRMGLIQDQAKVRGQHKLNLLCAGLSESHTLAPWMNVIQQAAAPLAGIYSIALLTTHLLKKLSTKHGPLLVVSQQRSSGLRQSFFENGHLRMSRLTPMRNLLHEAIPAVVVDEIGKTQRFLSDSHLIEREMPLPVYLLSQGPILDRLQQYCRDREQHHYRIMDIADLASSLRFQGDFTSTHAELLFIHIAGRHPLRNHYAPQHERRIFHLQATQSLLRAAALPVAAISLVVAGMNGLEGLVYQNKRGTLIHEAQLYEQLQQETVVDLPPLPSDAISIKAAVDAAGLLLVRRDEPTELITLISHALTDYPDLQVDSVHWLAGSELTLQVQDLATSYTGETTETPPSQETLRERFHIAVIRGHIASFDGNYSAAIQKVEAFIQHLRSQTNIFSIQTLSLPLNTDSHTALSGETLLTTAATERPPAVFTVRVVLRKQYDET